MLPLTDFPACLSRIRVLGLLCLTLAMVVGCGMSGELGHLGEQEFEQLIQDSDVVLVKFGASFCGPCNRLDDELDALAGDLPNNVRIVRLQTSQNPELCRKFEIRSIPRMLLYRNGNQVGDKLGYITQDQILNWVGSSSGTTTKSEVQANPFAT